MVELRQTELTGNVEPKHALEQVAMVGLLIDVSRYGPSGEIELNGHQSGCGAVKTGYGVNVYAPELGRAKLDVVFRQTIRERYVLRS